MKKILLSLLLIFFFSYLLTLTSILPKACASNYIQCGDSNYREGGPGSGYWICVARACGSLPGPSGNVAWVQNDTGYCTGGLHCCVDPSVTPIETPTPTPVPMKSCTDSSVGGTCISVYGTCSQIGKGYYSNSGFSCPQGSGENGASQCCVPGSVPTPTSPVPTTYATCSSPHGICETVGSICPEGYTHAPEDDSACNTNEICCSNNAPTPTSYTNSGSGSIPPNALVTLPTIVCSNLNSNGQQCDTIQTGVGPITTQAASFINSIFTIILSISGGIALILIIVSGYQLSLSSGNPEKVKEAQGMLTAAIVGFIFIIFSVAILQIIGVDILGSILPTFGK